VTRPNAVLPLACGLLAVVIVGCGRPEPLLVAGQPIASGPGGGEVVLADVDGDGHIDVIAKFLLRRLIAVHFGAGPAGFGQRTPATTMLEFEPGAMAVGDLDEDGRLDLVIANRESEREFVHVLLGDGRGDFAGSPPSPYTVPGSMTGYKPIVRIADVDHDGQPDVIVANGRRNRVDLFRGDGAGALTGPQSVILDAGHDLNSFQAANLLFTFDVADMSLDGDLDLVYAASIPGRAEDWLAVRLAEGRGWFGGGERSALVPAQARLVGLGDADGDGRPDVVLGHGEARRLSLLLNGLDGRLRAATGSPWAMAGDVFDAVVHDVDRDGRPDLVAATAESVTVLLRDGQAWTPAPGSPFPTGRGTYNLAVGDVNEDRRPDVVASGFEADEIAVLLSR
jgi:hypothetical protein